MGNEINAVMPTTIASNKIRNLIVGIIMDLIGNLSYAIPGLGESFDIIWAPISAYVMKKLYPTRSGTVASVISFIEEAVPGIDLIPSFTIMWFYTYVLRKNK